MSIVWTDIETTGLEPLEHAIFEVACVENENGNRHVFWFGLTPAELSRADPGAIKVNRYYGRKEAIDGAADPGRNASYSFTRDGASGSRVLDLRDAAKIVASLLMNNTIGGNNPSFDAGFLAVWLRRQGQCPAWHHYTLCAPTVGATVLGMDPPFKAAEIARGLGVEQHQNAHMALPDALYSKAIYDAAMTRQRLMLESRRKT